MGVGITIAHAGVPVLISAGVPLKGIDAARGKVLGPPLAAILVTNGMPPGMVNFFGNRTYVVDLLAATTVPCNLFLFNCWELTRDCFWIGASLLRGSPMTKFNL